MRRIALLAVALSLATFGCKTSHEIEVKPTEHTVKVQVEPIKINVDVNVKVQVEKELEDVFDFRKDLSGGAK